MDSIVPLIILLFWKRKEWILGESSSKVKETRDSFYIMPKFVKQIGPGIWCIFDLLIKW